MRTFILGTDWWTDCDDVVAVRILSRAARSGQIRLAGIGINACMSDSVPSLEGFLRTEGLTDIPLGIDRNATDFGGNPAYQKNLARHCQHYRSNEDAEDAVRLYRRILASAPEKIEILEIGFLQVMTGVLESCADDLSDLNGLELVREKVSHIWVMAGKWDQDGERENNFCRNPRARTAARIFCEQCPVPVTFLGFEIGVDVISGSHLEENDILHLTMLDHGSPHGRSSWDPMLVQLALTGDPHAAGYTTVSGTASVEEETGSNHFLPDPNGLHRYVIRNYAPAHYATEIDRLIASVPNRPFLCPACQELCLPDDRFCSACGTSVADSAAKPKHAFWPPVVLMAAMVLIGLIVYFATGFHHPVSMEYPWFQIDHGVLYFSEDAYTGASELVIPATVDGQAVTTLGKDCFANASQISTVLLPDSLIEIQAGAFRNCSALRGIYIPGGPVSLGSDVFQSCQNLEAICFAEVPSDIGDGSFDSCHSVRYIFFPGSSDAWFDLYDVFIDPYAYVICSDGVFPQGGQFPHS